MTESRFRKCIASRTVAHGVICSLIDPTILEIVAIAGYDLVIIEMEHQSLSFQEAAHMVRAGQLAGVSVLFRTPRNASNLLELADLGADGVAQAHVKTVADVRAVVDAVKYPPIGKRGLSNVTRSGKYGAVSMEQHMQTTNKEMLAMILLEEKEAVDNIDAILDVPGLDGAVIGPVDLSHSCGVPGQKDHPRVQEAIDRIMAAARIRPHLTVGSGALDVEEMPAFVRKGGRMVFLNDTSFALTAFRDALVNIKKSMDKAE